MKGWKTTEILKVPTLKIIFKNSKNTRKYLKKKIKSLKSENKLKEFEICLGLTTANLCETIWIFNVLCQQPAKKSFYLIGSKYYRKKKFLCFFGVFFHLRVLTLYPMFRTLTTQFPCSKLDRQSVSTFHSNKTELLFP